MEMISTSNTLRVAEIEEGSAGTVLVVSHAWYEDLYGGSFRVATELAVGLACKGWKVVYLCCNVSDSPERERIRGVDIRRYRAPLRSMLVPRFVGHIRNARALAKEICDEFKIVAVSGHSPLQYFGVLQALKPIRGCRRTHVMHSPFADEQLASAGEMVAGWNLRLRAWAGAFFDEWCMRRSDVVHCLSRFTAGLLRHRYGLWPSDRIVVCPGWVNATRFQPVVDRKVIRDSLPSEWHTNDPILLTVRRLESRMGLDTLVEAAARIAHSHRFRILIGGTGPLSAHLETEIARHGLEKRIFLLGRIPEEQLPLYYAAADVFVLPTRSLECFGLIVLEAFSTGTPVIGSRTGAIPELLSQVGNEWMFEPGDSEDLAACLRKFLNGEIPLSVDLRKIALQYDIQRLMPRWIEICLGPTPVANTSTAS